MELTASQTAALETILEAVGNGDPLVSLSGAAGTGKTTLIKELNETLSESVVCTPTNKASQVLCSKGIDASTFYKKFYILEETVGGKPRFISCRRWLNEKRGGLPDGKIDYAPVLIIDEASMVSSRSIDDMRRMCDTLILVGDHNQLPPVGDRDYPAGVFGSLRHNAELTEIMRQAEGSMILTLADALRQGDPRVGKMLKHFEPQESFQSLIHAGTQMIAFTNKERQRLNHVARRVLGFDQPWPQKGDKMVVTNNFSDDLINGTVVEVADFQWDQINHFADLGVVLPSGRVFETTLDMQTFIGDQIGSQRTLLEEHLKRPDREDDANRLEATFAYCLTAHKAQGSEWENVLVFDQRSVIKIVAEKDPRGSLSPDEYVRRWTYTAITRARKHLYWAPPWYGQVTERGF
jgi:exodeoxyribonuclease-5